MELGHLKYFYEVAKAGSFTSAARTLRVNQPSLSKAVALLEAREGVKLLERSKKGVSLTQIGAEVYQSCEQIFGTLQEVKNICQRKKEICEGYFNIGASDHIANYFLVKKVVAMTRKHPKVIPSVFTGTPYDIVQRILKKELEFGLFFTRITDPGISYQTLCPVPLAAVYHPKFKQQHKNANHRGAYIGSIQHDYKTNPAQEILDELNISPDSIFESNSQEMQKRLCLAGAGLAILARFMVEEEIKRNILLEIPIPKQQHAQIYIATRKNATHSLNAKTFLGLLVASTATAKS
jgi:DNA-binding transcriptional LysR family regulator